MHDLRGDSAVPRPFYWLCVDIDRSTPKIFFRARSSFVQYIPFFALEYPADITAYTHHTSAGNRHQNPSLALQNWLDL
eukprot:8929712-Ditylum_brightwellii.AAC.2